MKNVIAKFISAEAINAIGSKTKSFKLPKYSLGDTDDVIDEVQCQLCDMDLGIYLKYGRDWLFKDEAAVIGYFG